MSNQRKRLRQSTPWLIVLTLIASSLVALVVTMSTSRIGTVRLPENRLGITYTRKFLPGGHFQQPCSVVGARCRRAAEPPRGAGAAVPSWEIALAGLIAASAVGVLWKTRRTQESDATQVASGLESSPSVRRIPANPREMVLAAFADVEERLASRGIARDAWEAPESYLARAAAEGARAEPSASKLARLYALARYSRHPIDRSAATQAESAAAELFSRIDPPPEPT